MIRTGLLALLFSTFLLAACGTSEPAPNGEDAGHLKLPALFTGTLPCADCAGIQYALSLYPDHSYALSRTYLGNPEQNTRFFELGQWSVQRHKLTLNPADGSDASQWRIVDGHTLQALAADGEPSESGLDYTLERTGEPVQRSLTNVHWQLIRLQGERLTVDQSKGAPYIVLKAEESRVSGSDGCNRIMGTYQHERHKLDFSKLAGTLMACPDPVMQTAGAFRQMLKSVRSYRVLGGHLVVYGAQGKRLAIFRATVSQ